MNSKVLVAVPVYNCPFSIVRRTINSLISQNYPYLKIIVIDDYSQESLFSSLREMLSGFPQITLIRHEKNIGFANTLNEALGLIGDEEFFFVLEHDCELLSTDYISNAVRHFNNDHVGAVSGENMLPPVADLSPIKRVFVNHLSEDVHDSMVSHVGFSLLKADAFRIDVLRKVGGFESAGHWKFASEEHIISYKIRSLGYTILKDPNLRFRAYWGGQENLRQNLKKEALYGRGLGCAFATKDSDLKIGISHQLKSKRFSRIIQLQYVVLTVFSLSLVFYYPIPAISIACCTFLIYLVYLIRRMFVFSDNKEKLLFIVTGYLRAWVYIPNFCFGILYGIATRFYKKSSALRSFRSKEASF